MAYVLAGGRGSRLMELTDKRAKPAVYFGGKTRIIDFALSNALNSGIRRIGVATQYKAHSLIRHLQRGWNFLRPERNESFDILPASQRVSEDQWYAGTADAVFQNLDIIESYGPKYMVILAGDHIYKMDYELMLQQHVDTGADVTVGCLEVPRMEATGFGVMHVDDKDRIISFLEKPKDPPGMPGQARHGARLDGHLCLRDEVPLRPAAARRRRPELEPRFRQGHHPLSRQERQSGRAPLRAAPACARTRRAEAYWRDVGTVDAYWEANIDLTDIVPALDLYDHDWPIWTYVELTPPAKFVHDEDGRRGMAVSSLVSGGCIVSGATRQALAAVHRRARQLLCRASRKRWCCPMSRSAATPGSSKVVIDRGVKIPEGLVVGEDPELDAQALPAHREAASA